MNKCITTLQNVFLIIALSACQFPDDPENTLKKIRDTHRVKMGVCLNHATPQEEIELLQKLAQDLEAQITWFSDNQEVLYRQLQAYKIDIAACAIRQDSPWSATLAFTVPYHENAQTNYVLALPPGENAWLKRVNEFLDQQRTITHAARH